jgi:hypothetical protein
MSEDKKEPVCTVCRLTRIYLVIAVPLVIAIALGPETSMNTDFDLTQMAAAAIGVGFVAVVGWRAYQEYWRKD